MAALTSLNVAESQEVFATSEPHLQLIDVEVPGHCVPSPHVPVVASADVEVAVVVAGDASVAVGDGLPLHLLVVHEQLQPVVRMPGHLHVVPAVRFEPGRRDLIWRESEKRGKNCWLRW